ncbi:MAG: peptide chain release factor N(5)-glutamine methyltransferase [Acidimicrobiia bacterium]
MTPAELLDVADLPRHEAERLLRVATGLDRIELATVVELEEAPTSRFRELVRRRRDGEPLQFLEGTVQFGPLELTVDSRALIPRPETELVWEMAVRALGEAGPGTVIVDLCTGSGNLALALKHVFPEAQVYATDLSEDALALAEENAARAGVAVTFLVGDLFQPLPPRLRGRIDLVVSNPPYLAEHELDDLPLEVRAHEPRRALVAGAAGDEVLARLADEAYWWLGIGGWLLCEIAETQGERALELFGALDREIHPDLAGRDRILVGRKDASCSL